MLPGWKASHPSLKLVHSQVLQNVTQRVDLAFQAFFRRVKEGAAEVGYPRFKGFGRYDSITYPQYGNGVAIRGTDLILSKIGRVKVVWHRPVEGQMKTVTLRRARTGKWYVSISVEVEPGQLPPSDERVGVDVGLRSFATLSNGKQIDNPLWLFSHREYYGLSSPSFWEDRCRGSQFYSSPLQCHPNHLVEIVVCAVQHFSYTFAGDSVHLNLCRFWRHTQG